MNKVILLNIVRVLVEPATSLAIAALSAETPELARTYTMLTEICSSMETVTGLSGKFRTSIKTTE